MIFGFLYFIVVVAYIACFVAFMNSKRGDKKYWDIFSSGFYDDSWKFDYQLKMVFGALFWPISIPGYLLYRVVYKQAEKFFGK
jgi:hypothetical protein